jgi:pilus assembly protein FimV
VHLSKIKKLSIALGLTLLPISVLAAGLGQLKVASGIGEPLKAEIELLSVTPAEKASLKAKIAPESTYTAQGLERPASHQDIKVQIAKSSSGKNILKLRSNQPITEPFLDMLVEVEWETGRILREYTVLLDPPGYNRDIATAQVDTPVIKSTENTTTKPIAPLKKKATSTSAASTTASTTTDASLDEDYLTRRGDTLSKIARRMKPEGVSLDQMLVGLFEANPDAFVGKNMNRLKVGKILQKPSAQTLSAIGRKEAAKEIKVQTANWNEYRNKLAGIVEASTPQASEEESQSSSGKIKPATEDKSAESTGPKDVVKLSSGDAKAAEADMQAKITALQEEVSAREKGLKEAQERTAALEKQIEDMQKLLTLKNNALAEAQEAGKEGPDEVPTAEVVAEAEQPQQPAPVQLGTKLEGKETVTSVTEEKPAAKPAPVEQAKPTPTPVEQPGFLASMMETVSGVFGNLNATLIAAVGGLLALLIGAWFYLRNKRRKNLADFEQGIMTSGGLKANTVFGNTSGASVDTGDTSFLTDFSQSTSGGMIDTNDVDPIAEAEVYMAYGRDAQAEEILKDAISKEPKRYELHLKLLEMYAASKDMSAFETVSGELYTTLGAEDPTWAKVAEIGIKLEPNNPLYQIKEGAAIPSEAAESTDSNTDGELDASDFADSPLASEADLDFSLNDEEKPEEAESNEAASLEDVPTIPGEAPKADDIDENVLDVSNAAEVLETDDSALEFNLNTTEEQPVADAVSDDQSFANTMPNLDFPSIEENDAKEQVAEPEVAGDDTAATDSVEDISAPELEMPSDLTLDMPQTEVSEEVKSEESATEEAEPENFGFDVNTLTEDTVTLEGGADKQEPEVAAEPNVLDMSDISLEVNDDVNAAISEATPEPEVVAPVEAASVEADSNESEEVETKLELVAAYIDMEDKEGAKELLDEVLKEGGANQRKRAEDILATLG